MELKNRGLKLSSSPRAIDRMITRKDFIRRRTTCYEPKGKRHPVLPFSLPNDTHKVDLVGSFYTLGTGGLLQSQCV